MATTLYCDKLYPADVLAWSEIQLLTVVRHLNVFVQQKEEVVQNAYSSVDLGAEIKMQNESELN